LRATTAPESHFESGFATRPRRGGECHTPIHGVAGVSIEDTQVEGKACMTRRSRWSDQGRARRIDASGMDVVLVPR